MVNNPLWSAYADAKARADLHFIKATLKRSLLGTAALAAFISGAVLLASPWLLEVWIGHHLEVPLSLLAADAVWAVIDSTGSAFGTFLNGIKEVKSQVSLVVLLCALALPLKIVMTARYGVAAVVWATVAAYIIYMGTYVCVFGKRIRANLAA
jgi:O-antigen/teichoic acid export membrane protein